MNYTEVRACSSEPEQEETARKHVDGELGNATVNVESEPWNQDCSLRVGNVDTEAGLVPAQDCAPLLPPLSYIHHLYSDSESGDTGTPDLMCRICRCEPGSEKIISPCYCSGTLQYVHQSCLLRWLKANDCVDKHHCELCQYEFKLKPLPWVDWRMPSLSATEQRRATCLVVICVLATLIVIWSINDLIQNIDTSRIYTNWSFWTKLLFIVFGLSILAFQYPAFRYFYVKLRESNQIVMWGHEDDEDEEEEDVKLREKETVES